MHDNEISIEPPTGWTIEAAKLQINSGQESGGVTLKSADYKEDGTEFKNIISGMKFIILTTYSKNPGEDVYLSSKSSSVSGKKSITVGGQNGYQYFFNPGEFGTSLHTSVVYKNLFVSISASPQQTATLKEPYLTIYNQLINSIKFDLLI